MNYEKFVLALFLVVIIGANGHLQLELASLRAELSRLRRSKQLAAMRGDRRQIERAAADARFLAALHLAGLSTSRRDKDLHGLTRWRHEGALSILRLGRIYGHRGWKSFDPGGVHEGIERGMAAALANPERWKLRLPTYRTVGRKIARLA